MKYTAVIAFTCGTHSFKAGQEVPEDLPHNASRLARGLIKETKVIKPKETKVVKDEPKSQSIVNKRKSKNTTKRNKQ